MKLFLFFLTVLSIFILFSCQQTGFLNKPETSGKAGSEGLTEVAGLDTVISSAEGSNSPIYLFDFSAIKLVPTNSIDIEIKNYALYQDIYGDLLIFGEILNNSGTIKTNLEITFDFSDLSLARIDFKKIPAYTEYLQPGKKIPFCIVYEDRSKYINLGEVKIGANYKNYNRVLQGFRYWKTRTFFIMMIK